MNEAPNVTPKPPGAMKKAAAGLGEGSRKNAEGIGMAGAIVAAWAITTFGGVELPAEVTVALGTLIGAVAARIKG